MLHCNIHILTIKSMSNVYNYRVTVQQTFALKLMTPTYNSITNVCLPSVMVHRGQ